jgi:hypothetical protein
MTLREELLREFSKKHTLYLKKQIGPNQEAFDELMTLFLGNEYRVTQRAAWVVSHCADEYPFLLQKHIKPMILNLQNDVNDSVKRNTVRALRDIEIPKDLHGITTEICFSLLKSGKEPVAIKIHAMVILQNIVKIYPELKDELKLSIEEQLPYGSAGFKNRGNKVLKSLDKI